MEKVKNFVKTKEVLRKLAIATGLLIAVWIHFIIFNMVVGRPLTQAEAKNILVTLNVLPSNPVAKINNIEVAHKQAPATDYKTSDFRLISAIPNSNDNNNNSQLSSQIVVKRPIVTFKGKTIYPNSEVFLVISSDKIYTSVKSDDQGNWSWTNLGYPLESGQHTIEASNISPYDLSGTRDVFVQEYSFTVQIDGSENGIAELPLENIPAAAVQPGTGYFSDKFRNRDLDDTYLFDIALLNKKEYNPGDEVDLSMIFNPLGKISKTDVKINYEIYSHNEDTLKDTLVYTFEDTVDLTSSQGFLKKIMLKNDVQKGSYFIKVAMTVGDDRYIQSDKFTIVPKTLIQIGSTKIDENDFSVVVTWDIIFILGFSILILVLITFEYRKMFACNLVDEDELMDRHYFSN